MDYFSKFVVGTGASINIPLGFWPERVSVKNISGGTLIYEGAINTAFMFDGGGGAGLELKAGDVIENSAGSASGRIKDVFLTSGSWAAGTAAGIIVLEVDEYRRGTFADNQDLGVVTQKGLAGAGNYATTNGGEIATTLVISAAVAKADAVAKFITAYAGVDGSAAKGITLGSTISVSGELLFVEAFRAGAG